MLAGIYRMKKRPLKPEKIWDPIRKRIRFGIDIQIMRLKPVKVIFNTQSKLKIFIDFN